MHEQILASFDKPSRGSAPTKQMKMAGVGLVNLVLLAVAVIVILLIVRAIF